MSDPQIKEAESAKKLENTAAQLPSTFWLTLAVGTMVGSAVLKASGSRHTALFVGQWVAPFMLFGIYNKLIKTVGND